MFASADMYWYVEGVIIPYFNVLTHIRWADKQSMAKQVPYNNQDEIFNIVKTSYL